MRCPDRTRFTWIALSGGAAWNPEQIIATTFSVPDGQTRTEDCTLEGVATRCWTVTSASAEVQVHITSATVVGEKRLAAMCTHGVNDSALPPACRSALSLRLRP